MHPENVEEVMNKLRFQFGRPELIVKAQLEKVRKLSNVEENNADQIITFSNKIANMVTFIKSCEHEHFLSNPLLLEELIGKLPQNQKFDWAHYCYELGRHATIQDFSNWLTRIAEITSMLPTNLKEVSKGKNVKSAHVMLASSDEPRTIDDCNYCNGSHPLKECKEFQNITIEARWDHVLKLKLCFSCLRKGHGIPVCRRRKRCAVNNCRSYHSILLHDENRNKNSKKDDRNPPSSEEPSSPVLSCKSVFKNKSDSEKDVFKCENTTSTPRIMLKTLQVILFGSKGRSVKTYALIDEGSTITMINDLIAKKLGLSGTVTPLTLKWLGGNTTTINSEISDIEIIDISQTKKRSTMKNVRIVNDMKLPAHSMNVSELSSRYHHLKNLPITSCEGVEPQILIGLDNIHVLQPIRYINGKPGEPSVMETELGFVVFGAVNDESINGIEPNCLSVFTTQTSDDIYNVAAEYFACDGLGVQMISPKTQESSDDIRAKEIMYKTTNKIGQRYETGLIWVNDNVTLPSSSSYAMAKSRLMSVEKRMNQIRILYLLRDT